MSFNNSNIADTHGRRLAKAVDKSNFTQTCHLLSQFLKDKRSTTTTTTTTTSSSAHHLTLPFTTSPAKSATTTPAATMNLLSNPQDSDDASRQMNTSAMDFLPQFMENPSIKQSNLRSETLAQSQSKSKPQLSIFYAGKVLVFDGFPPEKATEVMELATKLGSDDNNHFGNQTPPPLHNSKSLPPSNTSAAQSPQQAAPDMRYPRRASLVKFLEKRKERVIAKGPYHMNNPNPKNGGSSSGDDPEQNQSSEHFDLNS